MDNDGLQRQDDRVRHLEPYSPNLSDRKLFKMRIDRDRDELIKDRNGQTADFKAVVIPVIFSVRSRLQLVYNVN